MTQRFNSPPGWPTPPDGWTPPEGWKPDPSWPAAPPGWQLFVEDAPGVPAVVAARPTRPRVRSRGWLIAAGVVAFLVVASALSQLGNKRATVPVAHTTPASVASVAPAEAPSTVSEPSAAATTTAPTVSKQAVRFVNTTSQDATDVQTDVVAVESGIQLLAKDPNSIDQAALDQLASLAQQGHDDLSSRKDAIAVATDGTGQIQNLEAEAYAGVNDMKNSLGALVAYTGNPNPATLAQFTSQFQTGKGEWNDAVTQLWQAAAIPNPPTV